MAILKALPGSAKVDGKPVKGKLIQIKKSVISIDKFLERRKERTKKQVESFQKQNQKFKRRKKEEKLEEPKSEWKKLVPKKIPGLSFLDSIKKFIGGWIFGFIAIKLIPLLPSLIPVVVNLGKMVNFIINIGGALLNGLISFVDFGVKAQEATFGFIKNLGGEKFAENFAKFAKTFGFVIDSMLILGVLMLKDALSGDSGFGLGDLFGKKGLLKGVGKLFGKKAAASGLTKTATLSTTAGGTTAAGGTAAGGSAASTAGGIGAGAAAGIVAGAGLLASGLGEGMFQLKKQSQNSEDRSYTKFKNASWWNPMKYFHGAVHLGDKFNSYLLGTLGVLLDILGTPFRYFIELVRYPFLDEAGKKKQNENMAKFDARIREQFREMINAFSLGILAKDKGAFGSLFGDKGTDAMGYTEDGGKRQSTKAPQGGTILLSTPNLRLTNLLLQDMPGKRLVHTIEKTTKTPKKVNENEKVDNKNKDKMAAPWWKFWGDGKDDPSIDRKKLMKNDENVVKKSSTSSKKVSANFDMNTGKAYINNEEVSVEEYSKFQNLSQKEKLQQYGRSQGNSNNITPFDVNSVAKKAENISMNTSYQEGGQQEQLVVIPDKGEGRRNNNTGGNVVEKPILQVIGGSGGDDPYSNLYEGG